jgi:hypothetical protein
MHLHRNEEEHFAVSGLYHVGLEVKWSKEWDPRDLPGVTQQNGPLFPSRVAHLLADYRARAASLTNLASVNYSVKLGFKIALAVTVVKFPWDLWQAIVSSRASQKSFVTVF